MRGLRAPGDGCPSGPSWLKKWLRSAGYRALHGWLPCHPQARASALALARSTLMGSLGLATIRQPTLTTKQLYHWPYKLDHSAAEGIRPPTPRH